MLHIHHSAVTGGDGVIEGRPRDVAIGALRQQRRELMMAVGGGIAHHPAHFDLGQEAEQISAIARHASLGRERQHRHATIARNRRHRRDRRPEQRADNHFGALRQKLLGRLDRGRPAIALVGGHQKDVAIAGIEHGQLGRLQHRSRQIAGAGRAAGKGQDHPHPHRHLVRRHARQAQIAGQVMVQRVAGNGRGRRRRRHRGRGRRGRRGTGGYRKGCGNGTKAGQEAATAGHGIFL